MRLAPIRRLGARQRVLGRRLGAPALRRLHSEAPAAADAGARQPWRVWAALETRDEAQKVRMAHLLHELEALAAESGPAAAASHAPEQADETGLHLPTALTPGAALDAFGALARGMTLHPTSLLRLLDEVSASLAEEPTLLDLRDVEELYVVGDLHGDLESMQLAIKACGGEPKNPKGAGLFTPGKALLFNGDFVDRGSHSTEVVASLLLLKRAYPASVWLLRGNHEDGSLATAYGMRDEVRAKHPAHADVLWAALLRFFGALPVAAHTREAFVVHGGLPARVSLGELRELPREARAAPSVLCGRGGSAHARAPGGGAPARCERVEGGVALLRGLLWSDPVAREAGLEPNAARGGEAGMLYGTDVAREWLTAHGLRVLVRSHQVVEDGWERIECGEGTSVYTVFSSANYPNAEGWNRGAVLRLLRGAPPEPIEFSRDDEAAAPRGARAKAAAAHARQLLSLQGLVLSHRHRLGESFAEVAPQGRVAVGAWCEVMRRTLGLELEWAAAPRRQTAVSSAAQLGARAAAGRGRRARAAVQPELAATVKRAQVAADGATTVSDTGLIDYRRFLQAASSAAVAAGASGGGDAAAALPSGAGAAFEALHSNAPQLKLVFQFLDSDGSGVVEAAEFRAGIELLNRRLPPEQTMSDIDVLFEAIDLDGNGQIEFDEFCAAFKL